jgi:hypothetical protein
MGLNADLKRQKTKMRHLHSKRQLIAVLGHKFAALPLVAAAKEVKKT